MNILLIQPPLEDYYSTSLRSYPLGLVYVANYTLHDHDDIHIRILDTRTRKKCKKLPTPLPIHQLDALYIENETPFSSFHSYKHIGLSYDAIAQQAFDFQPDIIGISALFTAYFPQVIQIAARIKKKLNHVPIILGGGHPSLCPVDALQYSCIDALIRGDGEYSFSQLIHVFKQMNTTNAVLFQEQSLQKQWKTIPGLCYKLTNTFRSNLRTDHEKIAQHFHIAPPYYMEKYTCKPMHRSLEFEMANYSYKKSPLVMIQTSRGCKHHCRFCAIPLQSGNQFRQRSVSNVLEEIEGHYNRGVRHFDFEDDHFLHSKSWVETLLHELCNRYGNRTLHLYAMNGFSYQDFTDTMLELLWNAGFSHLDLPWVSSSPNIQQEVFRPHSPVSYANCIQQAYKQGFTITGYLIIGMPNQSLQDQIKTILDMFALPLRIAASFYYPIPGIPLSNDLNHKHVPYEWYRMTSLKGGLHSNYSKQVHTLFLWVRWLNWVKECMGPMDTHLHFLNKTSSKYNNSSYFFDIYSFIQNHWKDCSDTYDIQLLHNRLHTNKPLTQFAIGIIASHLLFTYNKFFAITPSTDTIYALQAYPVDESCMQEFLNLFE